MKKHLLLSSFVSILSLPLAAQTPPGEASPGIPNQSETVSLRAKKKEGAANNKSGAADAETTPRVKFSRKWDEGRAQLRVSLENPETTELKIEGVQTSANLFVARFPAIIKPGGREEIILQYSARAGASGDIDSIRLLTNQGEKVIEVMQDRESSYTVSAKILEWKMDEALAPKTVMISTTKAGLRPVGLHVLGSAKPKMEIRPGAAGQFAVDITPASTLAAEHFAVMVDFEPAVPGNVLVIQCAVKAAK